MTDNPPPEQIIRANAEAVLGIARGDYGQDVGFDEPGVVWLNAYIQEILGKGGVEASEELCDNLGSFLGTCIIETYGGHWQDTEYGWAVVIKDDFAVFPFNKVLKHLTEGEGDSVLGLFTSIPAMLGDAVSEPAVSAPPTAASPMPSPPAEAEAKPTSMIKKLGSLFRRR